MHIRFEVNHLKASPQIEEQYETEVLSGRLRLFQKELLAPEAVPTSQSLVIHNIFQGAIYQETDNISWKIYRQLQQKFLKF